MSVNTLFDFSSIHQNGYSLINIISLILLALALIWGFIKGFGKGTVKAIANYAGLALAYFGGIPLGQKLISLRGIENHFIFDLYYKNLPTTDVFSLNMSSLTVQEKNQVMSKALSEMKFPTFTQGIFTSHALILDSSVAEALASSFTFLTVLAICFILLYLFAYILVRIILGKISGLVFGENGKNFLGRIAGMVKYIFKTGLTLLTIMAVIIFINQMMLKNSNTSLNDWLVEDLKLSDGNYFSIGRLIYNTAGSLLNWISL